MDLLNLDVTAMANEGSVLELVYYADAVDPKTGIEYKKGDVITSGDAEYRSGISDIESNSKISNKEKQTAKENLKLPKPYFIRLLGSDSDTYRRSSDKTIEKYLNTKEKDREKGHDANELRLKTVKLLAKCTTECYMLEGGKEISCNRDEMTRLYMKLPWLREQAEAFITDRSNFTAS